MNASNPEVDTLADEYDGGFLPLATAMARMDSTRAINSALGNADKHIEEKSTTPTSSASPSCASLAAPSNSFATAQLIANVRSPPSADSASVAPPDPSIDDMVTGHDECIEHEVSKVEFQHAAAESRTLSREGQLGPMRLRRLLFSRNDPYAQVAGSKGVKKRNSASARSRYQVCFATIFGATLKTILDFSGVATDKKAETVAALHEMLQFLGPVGEIIGTVGGTDQPHLVNGLATHKVSRKQAKLFVECSSSSTGKNTWFTRSGLKDVTMGVTAGVLVAHYVMAATGCDALEVATNLAKCTDSARSLLSSWDVSRSAGLFMHKAALAAEIRALERARAASYAASKVAEATGLDRMTALHLQLSYMRSAAWPNGVCCGTERHAQVVSSLEKGDPIAHMTEEIPPCMPSMPVLQLLRCMEHGPVADHSSDSEFSSLASSSAASSIASDDGVQSGIDSATQYELIAAVQRMRSVSAHS